MELESYSDLNDMHKDVLREVGNIGTGNAITALSRLTQTSIEMNVPKIKIIKYRELPALLGDKDDPHAGVVLTVDGDIDGVITFILNENFARTMLKNMIGESPQHLKDMDSMAESAVCEVGNVMCNSYLNALAIMANLQMSVSVPNLRVDSTEGILDTFVRKYLDKGEELLFIENTFYYEKQELISHILMHPKFHSITELLSRMGVE